jgi:hypothetical protein
LRCDQTKFLFLPVASVIYQAKKNITGFSFALGGEGLGGVNFSHQTHAVGLGFVERKILSILAGTEMQELWSLGSASTAV